MRVFDMPAAAPGRPLVRAWARSLTLLIVLGAAAALIFLLQPSESNRPSSRETPSPSSSLVHENRAAGYSFAYPRAWNVDRAGTVSTATSPGRDAIVSFGSHMPEADLLQTARRLTTLVSRTYGGVRMGAPRMEAINGELAVVTHGRATNRAGEKLRFLVAAIHGPTRTFGAVGFAEASTPVGLHEAVVDVVRSFQVRP
jgi:hypothetical protein